MSGSGRRHLPISRHRSTSSDAGAVLAVAHRAGHLDEVAEVDGAGEVRGAALVELRIVQQQLHFARPVAQLGEQHAAVVADAQHPARHRDVDVVGGVERLRDGVAGRLPDRVGVDAAVLQRLQLGHPDPHLLGQPRRVLGHGSVGRELRRCRVRCRRVQQARWRPGSRAPRVLAGVLLVPPARTAAPGSPRRSPRRRRPAGPAGRPRSRRTAAPTPAGTSCWTGTGSPAATTGRRTPAAPRHSRATGPGAELRALLERRPEHREVQRDPGDADALRPAGSSSLTISSMVPLGDCGERRIRSSDTPLVPHGTSDSIATTFVLARSTASTSRQSPSARITEAAQRHREAALGLGVAPGVGPLDDRRPSPRRRGRGAGASARSDPARRARVTAWRTALHVGAGQLEPVRVAGSPRRRVAAR